MNLSCAHAFRLCGWCSSFHISLTVGDHPLGPAAVCCATGRTRRGGGGWLWSHRASAHFAGKERGWCNAVCEVLYALIRCAPEKKVIRSHVIISSLQVYEASSLQNASLCQSSLFHILLFYMHSSRALSELTYSARVERNVLRHENWNSYICACKIKVCYSLKELTSFTSFSCLNFRLM